jgi:hypothetical protein
MGLEGLCSASGRLLYVVGKCAGLGVFCSRFIELVHCERTYWIRSNIIHVIRHGSSVMLLNVRGIGAFWACCDLRIALFEFGVE